jgi:putative peptidoglycan lipid II flippase
LGEGALTSALIPIFSECLQEDPDSKLELQIILNRVLSYLIPLLILISAVGIGILFTVERFALTERWQLGAHYGQMLFPYVIFICLAAIITAALNVLNRFTVTSLSPIWLNLCMITALFVGAKIYPNDLENQIFALCLGVLLGGLFQLLIPAIELILLNWRPVFRIENDPKLKTLVTLFLPGVAGAAILQINALISGVLALTINDSASAILYLSNRLTELPLGLFTVAISTVIFPQLAAHSAKKDSHRFTGAFRQGALLILVMNLPAMVGLILLNEEIIALLFKWKNFTAEDATITASVLIIYSIGLPLYSMTSFLTKGFHAHKDMKTPVRSAAMALFLNSGLGILFMIKWGMHGLAWAAILTYLIQTIYLYQKFKVRLEQTIDKEFIINLLKITFACCIMGFVCYFVQKFEFTMVANEKLNSAIYISIVIGSSTLAYFGGLFAMGVNITRLFKRKS